MKDATLNPFNITKAVDFSDQEINDYWVDISSGDGFTGLAKPTSPMPMLILGGKGSGKTHLMRYFSYPLQCIRHKKDVIGGIKNDKYIGVYLSTYINKSLPNLAANLKLRQRWRVGGRCGVP